MTGIDAVAIGERIGRYRREAGLSAQNLADQAGAGLTRSIIANMEAGRRGDIGVAQLAAIALVLRVPLAAFLVDLDAPDAWFDEAAELRNLDVLALLQGWRVESSSNAELGPAGEVASDRLYWLEQYAGEVQFADTWDLSDDDAGVQALRPLALIAVKLSEDGVALPRVDVEAMRKRADAIRRKPKAD